MTTYIQGKINVLQDDTIYVSTDVEADGALPGLNSMLSFGSAAFTLRKGLISTFSANLELCEGAKPDPVTKEEFWDKNPEAWAACRTNLQPVVPTMQSYVVWLKTLRASNKIVFAGYPATYDFTWIHYYLLAFAGESPFGFSALDIKSYVAAVLKKPFHKIGKRMMPKDWFGPQRHTHIALDDALEQGELLMNILKEHLTEDGQRILEGETPGVDY